MSIQYAILGLLSWHPLFGYDLKKIISESDIFYWSGSNNQIYHTLIQLHEDGLATQVVQYQENLPAKKVYTITEKGQAELRKWVLSTPQLPELHNTFLIQLAWADQLSDAEIDALLGKYEDEVEMQLRILFEKGRRGTEIPDRTPREAYLWKKIAENITATYQNELAWARLMREELKEQGVSNELPVGDQP